MYLFGTEISLNAPPRFVKVALGLLTLYWGIALLVFSRELLTGSMGRGLGYSGSLRFVAHYAPQLFFIPWIELNIFRKSPLFRTIPGVAFIAIGSLASLQYALTLTALLRGYEVETLLPMGIPPVWELALLLPLFLLVSLTGVMLLVGKRERAWFH